MSKNKTLSIDEGKKFILWCLTDAKLNDHLGTVYLDATKILQNNECKFLESNEMDNIENLIVALDQIFSFNGITRAQKQISSGNTQFIIDTVKINKPSLCTAIKQYVENLNDRNIGDYDQKLYNWANNHKCLTR
ncbi:MAG: hypothetical protein ACK4OM_07380 [Alphaproteobacteria bacterium]